jgi:hypothetical protein
VYIITQAATMHKAVIIPLIPEKINAVKIQIKIQQTDEI